MDKEVKKHILNSLLDMIFILIIFLGGFMLGTMIEEAKCANENVKCEQSEFNLTYFFNESMSAELEFP